MKRTITYYMGTAVALAGAGAGSLGCLGALVGGEIYDNLTLPNNQHTELTRDFMTGDSYTQMITLDEFGRKTARPLTSEEKDVRARVNNASIESMGYGTMVLGIGVGIISLGSRRNRNSEITGEPLETI